MWYVYKIGTRYLIYHLTDPKRAGLSNHLFKGTYAECLQYVTNLAANGE